MALPTKKAREAASLAELVWVLYGPPGIGKSTLVSAMSWDGRDPLFLHTTPVKYIDAMKEPIPTWRKFCAVVKELEARRPDRYSVLCVDTIDVLYAHCRTDVMEKKGLDHESDLDHGKGWDMVDKEFTARVARLVTLGYGVVFISHGFEREIKTRVVSYTKMVPSLKPAAWRKLFPLADIVGYCGFSNFEEGSESAKTPRRIWFEPTEFIECKDWTGKLPKCQVMHRDPRRTVAELLAALKGSKPVAGGPTKAGGKAPAKRVLAKRSA